MTNAPIQGKTLTKLGVVSSFNNFRAGVSGDSCGVVRAIVGHDQETVTRSQLSLDICNRWKKISTFVVSRHQYADLWSQLASGLPRRCTNGAQSRRNNLKNEDGGENSGQSGCNYEQDRKKVFEH